MKKPAVIKKLKDRRKPTANLIVGIKSLIQNRSVAPILLVPQKLNFLVSWQIEEFLTLRENLIHELVAYSVINHVKETRVETRLNDP